MRYVNFSKAIMATMLLCGCESNFDHRGKLPDPAACAQIKVGETDREGVLRLIGSPSNISIFNENTWIYASKKTETLSFFDPKVLEEKLFVVTFDGKGRVASAQDESGQGREIIPNSQTTPVSGQDRPLLQQVFGNFGRYSRKPVDARSRE